ncbi:MAG: hypothetical protein FWC41_08490 [Firmicutes bacterium]|nr:hypothetical protein [Bacillota bacterium]
MIKSEFLKKLAVLISILSTLSSVYATKNTSDKTTKSFSDRRTEIIKKSFPESLLSGSAILALMVPPILYKYFQYRKNKKNITNILKKAEPEASQIKRIGKNYVDVNDVNKVSNADKVYFDKNVFKSENDVISIVDICSKYEKINFLVREDCDGDVYKVQYDGKMYDVKVLREIVDKDFVFSVEDNKILHILMIGVKHDNLVNIYGVYKNCVVIEHCENMISLTDFEKTNGKIKDESFLNELDEGVHDFFEFLNKNEHFKDIIDPRGLYDIPYILVNKLRLNKNFKICCLLCIRINLIEAPHVKKGVMKDFASSHYKKAKIRSFQIDRKRKYTEKKSI